MKKPAMREDDLLRCVVAYAHLRRLLVLHCRPAWTQRGWRTPIQGDPGFVDVVVAGPAGVLFAELKSQRGKATLGQELWMKVLGAHLWTPREWFDGTIRRELDGIAG